MKSPQLRKITYAFLLFFASPMLAISDSPDVQNRLTADETLIVPGVGAEKCLIGEDIAALETRLGNPQRRVKHTKTEEVFQHIFAIPCEVKIPFDAIYYYGEGKGIFFLHHNTIAAIAGSAKNRVTSNAVSLEKGVQQFVFHYGNNQLTQMQKGRHRAYLYHRKGIAVFDDDGNDGINLYIVFRPSATP
jgi:hypothetical protein